MITFMRRYRRLLQVGLLLVIAAFVASLFVFGSSGSSGAPPAATRWPPSTARRSRASATSAATRSYLEMYAQMLAGAVHAGDGRAHGPAPAGGRRPRQEAVARAAGAGRGAGADRRGAQRRTCTRCPTFQEGGRFSMQRYRRFLRSRGYRALEHDLRRRLTCARSSGRSRAACKRHRGRGGAGVRACGARRSRRPGRWSSWRRSSTAATVDRRGARRVPQGRTARSSGCPSGAVQYVTLSPKDFPGNRERRRHREVLHRARKRVRDAPPARGRAHPGAGGGDGRQRGRGQGARARSPTSIKRAKAGEDFAKLAKEVSEDPGAERKGGDLGLGEPGRRWCPQFEQALFALKKGELTAEPVRTPFGFHAIKVIDVRRLAEAAQGRGAADPRPAARRRERRAPRTPTPTRCGRRSQAAPDFMAEAKKLGLTPVETTIAQAARPPASRRRDPLEEAAFGSPSAASRRR